MTLRRRVAGLFALLAAIAAQAGDFIDPAALAPADLVRFWQVQLPLAAGEQVRDAFLVDDQLYFGTDAGTVYAVHAYTGAIRWASLYTTGGYPMGRPTHLGDRTVVVTTPEMRQFDRLYGGAISRAEFRFPAASGAQCDGLRIFVGGFDRRLYAFGPDLPYEIWKVVLDSQVVSTPVVWKQFLYAASANGTVYSCESANKRFLWRTRLGGGVSAELAADENGVYIANSDRSLYLLDHVYGGLRWRARFNNPLSEPPVLTPEVAYQFGEGDGVVALDVAAQRDDQRVRWTLPTGRKLLTVTSERAYVWTQAGGIAALELKSGKLLHEAAAPGFTFAMPSPAKPAIFLADASGRIFCARHKDEPYVTAEEVRAAMRPEKPGAASQPAAAAGGEPVAQRDFLGSGEPGKPSGGKSKVSKEFGGTGGAGGGQP